MYDAAMSRGRTWTRSALATALSVGAVVLLTAAGFLVATLLADGSALVAALVSSTLSVVWLGLGQAVVHNRRQRRARERFLAVRATRPRARLHGGPGDGALVPVRLGTRRFRIANQAGGHIYVADEERSAAFAGDGDADIHLFYAPDEDDEPGGGFAVRTG